MAYGWRGEGLSSEGEPERMSGRADSIGRTYQDDSERSSRRKANEEETGWSQPAHKLQTRPPAKVLAARISMSHLVPLLEFNRIEDMKALAFALSFVTQRAELHRLSRKLSAKASW